MNSHAFLVLLFIHILKVNYSTCSKNNDKPINIFHIFEKKHYFGNFWEPLKTLQVMDYTKTVPKNVFCPFFFIADVYIEILKENEKFRRGNTENIFKI